MKTIKTLGGVLILIAILLSACAPAANSEAPANVGGGKAISDVIFTGVIESMNGDQWIINGQPIKVDQSVLRDGPFNVGDTVKVEASVAEDGSVTAQRVETPSLADLNTPEATQAPTEAPGATSEPLVFDNSGNEATGTVDAITDTSITVGGQTFPLAAGAEIKGEIVAGSLVKLHFTTNADGTLSVTEIAAADATQLNNGNSNDDNSNVNSNDDNGNDDNSNVSSNDDDSNDDHGGNSNDDSKDDDNGSDDNGGDNSSGNGNG